jgi:hypothetical protein
MEGPKTGVDSVIHRAASEPQHRNLQVLHRSRGPRRLTQSWSMAFRQDGDRPADFAARVAALLVSSVREQLEPVQVWRCLSMPHTAGAADCDAYQRVMVCSARGTRSFELVRWLGQAMGCHVTTQRLAGANKQMQDVANDYLDLPARRGAMPRRVVAMARNGLQIGLFQAFLADYSHVVLLLSGDSLHDMELVHLVLAACARAPESPVLLGIGWTGCDHSPLRQAAKTEGLVYLDCDVASTDPKAVWAAAAPALDFSRTARNG